ncbi:MAG: class I SAM-dependent methyltransferase [Deltaproteobacteria bacterium]|nr:class I SAM-dependent methyltransferase [Deltaproteobacteria bacterium]
MTCHQQAAELLAPYVWPGLTLLDAGCATGYFVRSFADRGLPVEYYGLDYTAGYIHLGRQNIPPEILPPERLMLGAIENLDTQYDAVLCINTLHCLPNYHQGLERLADAARHFLILRTALDKDTVIRYETDDYLDEGYRGPEGLKSYFNIYSMTEVSDFLTDSGFEVQQVVDRRTGDQPELSAGKVFPWKFLFARRRK